MGAVIAAIAVLLVIITLNYPWIMLWVFCGFIAMFILYCWYDSWV